MNLNTAKNELYIIESSHSFLGKSWFSKETVLTKHKEFIDTVLLSRPADQALGIYVNDVEVLDCLVVTDNGIFSIYKTKGRYIPYASILRISDLKKGDRELDIELVNGEFETLSVHGVTEDVPDVYGFREFLMQLNKAAPVDISEELQSVESREQLLALMGKHFGKKFEGYSELAFERLEEDLIRQNIDPKIKESRGFWRLIGLWRIEDALLHDDDNDELFVRKRGID